jgi:hypothetical protein
MVSLFVNNPDQAAQGGGLHALIIGISEYPNALGRPEHFGLHSVDGPAVSAWRFCEILRNPPQGAEWVRPLRTIRLLLSPSAADRAAAPEMDAAMRGPDIDAPTLQAVKEAAVAWRKNCEKSDDEAALFFFAGHGLRHQGADCLVCMDFGAANSPDNVTLDGCARFGSVFNGMLGPRTNYAIARRQFWFVDACRVETEGTDAPIGAPQDILAPRLEDGLPTDRPGLWSTGGALAAVAAGANGQTPFGAALIQAVQGAVQGRMAWPPNGPQKDIWPVTGNAIKRAVSAVLSRDPRTAGQVPTQMGQGGDEPLLTFAINQAPGVKARILVRPPDTRENVKSFTLRRVDGPPPDPITVEPFTPHPYEHDLVAGTYEVKWTLADNSQRERGWFATLGAEELALWGPL